MDVKFSPLSFFIPNRSLKPAQILFDCWSGSLFHYQRRSELRRENRAGNMAASK